MKLLFCAKCSDIIKLSTKGIRYCECGFVSGFYEDEYKAVVNGGGFSLAIDNNTFIRALNNFRRTEEAKKHISSNTCTFKIWIRPHEGPGNPNSRVRENLNGNSKIS